MIEITGPALHYLKTWPEYFEAVDLGEKTFEIRKNDRGFAEGDWLLLRCFEPEHEIYTGDWTVRRVDYILNGGSFGLEKNFVIMSISSPNSETAPLYSLLQKFIEERM